MDKYLLAVLVDNKPGVLTHIASLISRRAFNIESISAGYTEEKAVTRINIVVSVASENELNQVVTQLSKLIDVVKIVNLTQFDSITRELVLIKVRATKESRAQIIDVVNIFRARIVDVGVENVVVELTGDTKKIDALSELLSDYGIIEIARTGAIALSRGPVPVKHMEKETHAEKWRDRYESEKMGNVSSSCRLLGTCGLWNAGGEFEPRRLCKF